MTTPEIEVEFAAGNWNRDTFTGILERAAEAVYRDQAIDPAAYQISVLATDDAGIAGLNTDFRGKPAATNILSWPAQTLYSGDGQPPRKPRILFPGEAEALGDLALGYEICHREAAEQGKPPADHLMHLCIHGMLHLLGYDHISDTDAALMEGIEVRILAEMGIKNPYWTE